MMAATCLDFRGLVEQAQSAGHVQGESEPCRFCCAFGELGREDQQRFVLSAQYDWQAWARPEQLPPAGLWDVWVLLCGRGSGKTRPASQVTCDWSHENPQIALIAKDDAMVRDVMIEGESGILACSPPWWKPEYDRSKLRLTWPNGARAVKLSAEAGADAARGRQFYKAWAEEIATWPHISEAWNEGLMNALRLGERPQCIVTTTPQPLAFINDLCLGRKLPDGTRPVKREDTRVNHGKSDAAADAWYEWRYSLELLLRNEKRLVTTIIRQWSSERNVANLAPGYVEKRRMEYGVSRFGRQELDAELFEATGRELFTEAGIAGDRVTGVPRLQDTVVAIDPTRAESPTDECGIIVGGLGEDGHVYVMDDRTLRASPHGWLEAAVAAYRLYGASVMVYEQNRMGKTAENTMRAADPKIRWEPVNACEGKRVRAEPVSVLYAQHRVHHVGTFQALEDELTTWDPESGISPNRMDALVWLVTYLLLHDRKPELRLL